jgi:TPR repeat protein
MGMHEFMRNYGYESLFRGEITPMNWIEKCRSMNLELNLQSFESLLLSAKSGGIHAQFELGQVYEHGVYVTSNHSHAAFWYQRAAESNHPEAQLKLGWFYKLGKGVPADLSEALNWYRSAFNYYFFQAIQGDPVSQIRLGWIYQSGEVVEQDYSQAVKWFRKAAETNHPRAQFELGEMYFGGYGISQDLAEAYKWFLLAAEKSNKALEALEVRALWSDLTEAHKEEGRKRASQYKAVKHSSLLQSLEHLNLESLPSVLNLAPASI